MSVAELLAKAGGQGVTVKELITALLDRPMDEEVVLVATEVPSDIEGKLRLLDTVERTARRYAA